MGLGNGGLAKDVVYEGDGRGPGRGVNDNAVADAEIARGGQCDVGGNRLGRAGAGVEDSLLGEGSVATVIAERFGGRGIVGEAGGVDRGLEIENRVVDELLRDRGEHVDRIGNVGSLVVGEGGTPGESEMESGTRIGGSDEDRCGGGSSRCIGRRRAGV